MYVKNYLTIVLTAILVGSFLFGALVPVSQASSWRPPVIKCVTEIGTSIDIEQVGGNLACAEERCFYLDACIEDNFVYDCCYRYNKGLCDCICKIIYRCD